MLHVDSFVIEKVRFWVCVLIIVARESIFRSFYYHNLFLVFVVLLIIILFCTFSRINLFSFYLFFESRLIPIVFLILGWGYQPERLQAGIYLLFYTLLASLPIFRVRVTLQLTVSQYVLVSSPILGLLTRDIYFFFGGGGGKLLSGHSGYFLYL
jgi:NADH:ubiquinone oxidoreductase subunit 4 (subunit M)